MLLLLIGLLIVLGCLLSLHLFDLRKGLLKFSILLFLPLVVLFHFFLILGLCPCLFPFALFFFPQTLLLFLCQSFCFCFLLLCQSLRFGLLLLSQSFCLCLLLCCLCLLLLLQSLSLSLLLFCQRLGLHFFLCSLLLSCLLSRLLLCEGRL